MATCEKDAAEMKVWMFFLCLSNGLMQRVSITDAAPTPSSAPVTLAVDESTQLEVKKQQTFSTITRITHELKNIKLLSVSYYTEYIDFFSFMIILFGCEAPDLFKLKKSFILSFFTGLVNKIWIPPTLTQIHQSATGLEHCH